MTVGQSYRQALAHRDLRLLVSSFVIDGMGSWAYSTVLMVYTYQRTGSATWVAVMAAARWIPGLVLASFGGVVADRFERTRVMITCALVSAVVVGLMAALVAGSGPLWLLMLLSAVAAAAYVPYRPAAGGLTPDVVGERELAAANGIFAALENLVVVLGPLLAGVLLLAGEPVWGFLLNALSFVVAALLVSLVRTRSRGGGDEGEPVLRQLADGFGAIAASPVTLFLILFCALDSAIYGAATVLYAPMSESLGTGVEGYSYLLAGQALGGVVAAALADRLSRAPRLAPVILGGIVLQAVPFALTAFVSIPSAAFGLQVVSGVGMILVDVLAITALQRHTARAVLSRVLSVLDTAIYAGILLSSFLFAILFSRTGLTTSLLVIGVAFPLIAVLGIGPVRRADREAVDALRLITPRVAVLRDLDLLVATTNATLERLASCIEPLDVAAGEVLIREGDAADSLYVLVEGTAVATGRQSDGTERFLRRIPSPGYVGEIGLLAGSSRTATVTAETSLTVWRIPGEDFLAALGEGNASASLTGTLSARLARSRALGTTVVATGSEE